MKEDIQTLRKRLYMRSIRRGIKEMDLILTAFADSHLETLGAAELALYDQLLWENDHDIYQWVTGQVAYPDTYAPLMESIIAGADGIMRA